MFSSDVSGVPYRHTHERERERERNRMRMKEIDKNREREIEEPMKKEDRQDCAENEKE